MAGPAGVAVRRAVRLCGAVHHREAGASPSMLSLEGQHYENADYFAAHLGCDHLVRLFQLQVAGVCCLPHSAAVQYQASEYPARQVGCAHLMPPCC